MPGRTFLARAPLRVAWASNPGSADDRASSDQTELAASTSKDCPPNRDNDSGRNKNDKCKDKDDKGDKEDDDGEDDDEDDDDGTVKPPKADISVCSAGSFSAGGIATLEVKNLTDSGCLAAYTESADTLSGNPNGAGTVLSDALYLEIPASGANVKICFAVPPGKHAKIYSVQGSWSSLKTTVKNGLACAEASGSGMYALAGR